DSDDYASLRVEMGKISGLTPGKYYRVEEYDKEKIFVRNLFLQSDGKLNGDLSKIGQLTGDKIEKLPDNNALKNNYWYKVKLAQSFDPDGTYEYFAYGGSVDEADKSEDDEITKLTVKITGAGNYYLDLAYEIKPDQIYEVMKIASESWDNSRTSAHYKGNANISSNANLINLNNYTTDFGKPIGVYQYRGQAKIGSIDLQGRSIIELSVDTPLSNYVFVEYKNTLLASQQEVTNFTVVTVELKQTPTASDFDISGNGIVYYDGTPKAVTVTPLDDSKSQGEITVYYAGTNGTSYDSTDAPTDVGTYTVTFDVAEAVGWEEALGLPAGTLIIEEGIPAADDFTITGIGTVTYNGSPQEVTIEPKDDSKSQGIITIKYNTITTKPTSAGTYTVTFDVAADAPNWKAVTGLEA
ncbi:MBG domain-containing protein, partial [Treponema sp. R80B11-R83G3]